MSYRGRFAPSPTGDLHLGSLLSAVASFAQARANAGTWLVRIEDVDQAREVPGAAGRMVDTLAAFGMVSDEPVIVQSHRLESYRRVIDRLLSDGHAFWCGCTRRDLNPDGSYPGNCRDGLNGREARAVRVRAPDQSVSFDDRLFGRQTQPVDSLGDFVIRRADGFVAYQLAVVVDDAEQGITEIVRGTDLLDSTARQIWLQQLLGFPTPQYLHHPLIRQADGHKLSKQLKSSPVDGNDPMPALLRVWAHLSQEDPPSSARRSVRSFWNWAVPAWQPALIDCNIG